MSSAAAAWSVRGLSCVVGFLCALVACLCPAAALAFGPVGAEPGANIAPGDYPSACWQAPTGATCEAAAVASLQHSRAVLGQPAYALPGDFTSLTPAQQAFVLTNLDRVQYGLPPVAGLTAALGWDAAAGVAADADPSPSASAWTGWTANWGGGMPNMPDAYQMWMYDDGAGSGNLDCPYAGASGCWGHRHDILWQFDSTGPLVMGAAAGTDGMDLPGFAMLLVSERSSVVPSYTYTWAQAVAAGAGVSATASGSSSSSGSASSSPSGVTVAPTTGAPSTSVGGHVAVAVAPVAVRASVSHRRVSGTVSGGKSGAPISCSLSVLWHGRYVRDKFVRCSPRFAYVKVPVARYRLRVRVGAVTVTRYLVVR